MNNELINGIPSQQFNGEDCIIIPARLIRGVTYELLSDDIIPQLTIEVMADWNWRLR